jgi:hypothetical protein
VQQFYLELFGKCILQRRKQVAFVSEKSGAKMRGGLMNREEKEKFIWKFLHGDASRDESSNDRLKREGS